MTAPTPTKFDYKALFQQGEAFEAAKDYKGAFQCFFQVYQNNKQSLVALLKAAVCLEKLGYIKQAHKLYGEGLKTFPNSPELLNNLGNIYKNSGQLKPAVTLYNKAMKANPTIPEPYSNIGSILQLTGNTDKAITYFNKALLLDNQHGSSRLNLGLSQLLTGDFKQGWSNYEARLLESPLKERLKNKPKWQGESLENKTILVIMEQGFGDSIQFVRYLKLLKQKGATVLFECQPELISLFENLNYIDQLIPSGQANDINSDYISPLLSLPRVFNTDQSNISIMEPYLFPHKEKAALWQERLVAPAKINIGVVWAGSPTHRHDRYRSIPLKKLYHLFRFSHCRLFSFQKGPAEKQLEPFKNNMINLSPHIHDFSDTAAMLKAMDVVITVDTAVAHLAGALGIPTKLLLAYTPDWRWQLNRLDTPWYPSVKLYRQQSFNDWSEPVKKLIDDLKFINKLV